MHRYQPRIHVVEANDIKWLQFASFTTVSFPETVFMAVTAYQNDQVKKYQLEVKLKIFFGWHCKVDMILTK